MWIPEIVPDASLLVGAAVAVATALPVQAADSYVLGECVISRSESGAEIRPTYDGDSYFATYHSDDSRYKGFSFDEGAKVTLIKSPNNGVISLETYSTKAFQSLENMFHYVPNAGYIGRDRFVMQVEKNGVKVRIEYLIEGLGENEPQANEIGLCDPEQWKISTNALTPDALQSLQISFGLSNLVQVDAANLTGGAVGQTTGTRITLDTNAAGYDWFIDYTPYLNDEYLPTSNPHESTPRRIR